MSFNKHIATILHHEGGYVNDPADPGGETNMGISKKAWPKEDIKNMTVARASEIYHGAYWAPAGCEQLPEHLQGIHFDTAVNCGVKTAIKILQAACGVNVDGVLGPMTADAAQSLRLDEYVEERMDYYYRKTIHNPRLKKFMKGWERRTRSWLLKK